MERIALPRRIRAKAGGEGVKITFSWSTGPSPTLSFAKGEARDSAE
jgi:hypothetical protein